MNITDVGHLTSDAGEDRMEKGSRRTGKSAWEIAEIYADELRARIRALGYEIDDAPYGPLLRLHGKEPRP